MIQRVIVLFFIYILIFFSYCSINSPAQAEDIIPVAQKQTTLKVNSINFDNSDSIIFLGTSGGDNSSEIKKAYMDSDSKPAKHYDDWQKDYETGLYDEYGDPIYRSVFSTSGGQYDPGIYESYWSENGPINETRIG